MGLFEELLEQEQRDIKACQRMGPYNKTADQMNMPFRVGGMVLPDHIGNVTTTNAQAECMLLILLHVRVPPEYSGIIIMDSESDQSYYQML